MIAKTASVDHSEHCCRLISWTSVFAGALVGVGLGFLLNLFGVAIGLNAFSINDTGDLIITIGGLVGLLIGVIVSMVVAGYTSGYLGRYYARERNLGLLYGFVTWCLALLISAVFALQLSHYVMAYTAGITRTNALTPANIATMASDKAAEPTKPVKSTPKAKNTVEDQTQPLAWGALIIFGLFTIGAISTCLGACWGLHRRED